MTDGQSAWFTLLAIIMLVQLSSINSSIKRLK